MNWQLTAGRVLHVGHGMISKPRSFIVVNRDLSPAVGTAELRLIVRLIGRTGQGNPGAATERATLGFMVVIGAYGRTFHSDASPA